MRKNQRLNNVEDFPNHNKNRSRVAVGIKSDSSVL
jgi:hypothetical protein